MAEARTRWVPPTISASAFSVTNRCPSASSLQMGAVLPVKRLSGVPHRTGVTGVALLDGSLGHIECRVAQRITAGDHIIYIGEVVDVAPGGDVKPLAFHRGCFLSVA